ncbi:MAG: hypothetical protein R3F03_14845 [Opitutaceae bacterium]
MKRLVWLFLTVCAVAYVQLRPVPAFEREEPACCCADSSDCSHQTDTACATNAVCNLCPPCAGITFAVLSDGHANSRPGFAVMTWPQISSEGPLRVEQPALPPPRWVS